MARRAALQSATVRLVEVGRYGVLVLLLVAVAGALGVSYLHADQLPGAVDAGISLVLESSGVLLVMLVLGIAAGSRGARSPIVIAGLSVGAGALLVTGLLPGNLGFLGDALRFEVPKTVHYWLSTIAAVGAAAALAAPVGDRSAATARPGRGDRRVRRDRCVPAPVRQQRRRRGLPNGLRRDQRVPPR